MFNFKPGSVVKGLVMLVGVIASGKSSIFNFFSSEHFYKLKEPVDLNKRLPSFYAELKFIDEMKKIDVYYHSKITPMMEIFMSQYRADLVNEALESIKNNGSIPKKYMVMDYGVPSVFAKTLVDGGYMSKLDYQTFMATYKYLEVVPELVIFVDSLNACMDNIKHRGRECEKGLTIDYQIHLDKYYRQCINDLKSKGAKLATVKWQDDKGIDPLAITTILELNGIKGDFLVKEYSKKFGFDPVTNKKINYPYEQKEFDWGSSDE